MKLLPALLLSVCSLAAPPDEPAAPIDGVRAEGGQHRVQWEVSFPEEITLEEYARQMDYFKIEIAAASKDGKVEYVSGLTQRKPVKRVGNKAADYRLHIGWKSGTLHAIDRKLLRKAGIGSDQKELWHYFPVETQNLMEQVERAHAKRDPAELKRTRFEIRPTKKAAGYEFVVVEQVPPTRPALPAAATTSESQNKAVTK